MPDIVSIGEALIDFLSVDSGVRIENVTAFTVAPGGAPANVAAAVAKLGGSAGFIGKVGKDSFGLMIRNALSGVGVDVKMLLTDDRVNTSLAFIAVKPGGEPDFTFFRNRCGADLALTGEEIDKGFVKEAKILHYGSISFTGEPLKGATLRTIAVAKDARRLISYDPNLRPSLWDSLSHAKEEMEMGLRYADIVKITEEELEFVTGTGSLGHGCERVLKYGPRFVVVTRGSEPCHYHDGDMAFDVPGFQVKQVDSTGAGDAFVGGILLTLLEKMKSGGAAVRVPASVGPVPPMTKEEVTWMLRFAHACGALTVTRKGVIPALPTGAEVVEFLRSKGGTS